MSTLPTPRTDQCIQRLATYPQPEEIVDLCYVLERELTEAKAERDALKAALAIGQENCDAEYDRLRDERDEMTKVAQGACKAEGEALKREGRWRALAEELAGALRHMNTIFGSRYSRKPDVAQLLARYRAASADKEATP